MILVKSFLHNPWKRGSCKSVSYIVISKSNVVTSVPFTSYDNTKQNILNLKWELDTSKIPKSFDWCEYGLYAEDKDGNEVLYAYAYDNAPARLEKMEQGVIALYVGYVTVTVS